MKKKYGVFDGDSNSCVLIVAVNQHEETDEPNEPFECGFR